MQPVPRHGWATVVAIVVAVVVKGALEGGGGD